MLDLVTDLPSSLPSVVLSDWISLKDLVRLDAAYCNNEKRNLFLSLLRFDQLVCNYQPKPRELWAVYPAFWQWVIKRDVKLSHVTAGRFDDLPERLNHDQYLQRNAKYVRHLHLSESLIPFASQCKGLTSLVCRGEQGAELYGLLRDNLNLRELKLEWIGKQTHLFQGCLLPHLQQLDVRFTNSSTDCITALLAMSSNLCKLRLSGLTSTFCGMGFHSANLRSLSLETASDAEDIDVAAFVTQCPNLVNLHLGVEDNLTDGELLQVVQHLTHLRTLSLQFGAECCLTNRALESIALYCAATLEWFTLDLRNTSLCENHTNFTHGALVFMRAQCTKLHTFRCIAYAVEGNPLDGYAPFESVNVLKVVFSGTDQAFLRDVSQCPTLEYLELGQNVVGRCTVETVTKIRKLCPSLHTIVLNGAGFRPGSAAEETAKVAKAFPCLRVCYPGESYEYDLMRMTV